MCLKIKDLKLNFRNLIFKSAHSEHFNDFVSVYAIVYSSDAHHQGDLAVGFTMVLRSSEITIWYSREELLNIQHSEQRTDDIDWSHVDSTLHPSSNAIRHRIKAIIITRLSVQQRTKLQCNLITLPTYRSVTDIKPTISSASEDFSAPRIKKKPSNLVKVNE